MSEETRTGPSEPELSVLGRPSRHWVALGAQHARDLSEHGLDLVKRRQAFRYFQWRWSFDRLRSSEQLRFLFRHTSPRTWLRCALAPTDLSDEAWRPIDWPPGERWLYAFFTRLVWEYASSADRLGALRHEEPLLGSPLPVWWRGRLISQDLANSALELGAIDRALDGHAPRNAIEIGPGYGRNAYLLLKHYPNLRYTAVDIEPALSIVRWYLGSLFPTDRLTFLTPDQALALPTGSFDLGYSISTLQDMTAEHVSGYIHLLDRVVRGGTIYMKQWRTWYNRDDRVTLNFWEYPYPANWRLKFGEAAPIQTRFEQAAWSVEPPPRRP